MDDDAVVAVTSDDTAAAAAAAAVAAAAASVTVVVPDPDGGVVVEVDDTNATAAAAAALASEGGGEEEEGGGTDSEQQVANESDRSRIHRSLPRIKAILDDETYLAGILNVLENTGCANYPFASTSNGWMTAFHNVYASVALDCHHPVGKNRHHKFKDKIVEIWQAMESEIASGAQSTTHPLYALAMKQLETYRNVTRDMEENKPKKLVAAAIAGGLASTTVAATTAQPTSAKAKNKPGESSSAGGDGVEGSGVVKVPAAPRKKAKIQKNLNNNKSTPSVPGKPDGAASRSAGESSHASATSDMLQLGNRLDRLEALALEALPPKLSSPLNELHRLYVQFSSNKNRSEYIHMLQPYYTDAVGAFLTQVTQQANTTSHPASLLKALDGLEVLMRAHETCSSVGGGSEVSNNPLVASMKFTYKHALQAYLKLLNPQVASTLEVTRAAANRDKKRTASGEKKSGETVTEAVAAEEEVDASDSEGLVETTMVDV